MLKDELSKLRKLVKGAERGEANFQLIYKKLDRIEGYLQEDSEEEEEEFTPSQYIKPIQGLLDTYQKSMEKLRQQNIKLMSKQNLRQNDASKVQPVQSAELQPGSRKQAFTTITPSNASAGRIASGQRSSSSTQAKTIKELDQEILYLTNEIRNTLR